MLRVNSSSVLIVPPFECAWLGGEELQLRSDAGCIQFEVKSISDAAIIFKPQPGSKRWQEYVRGDGHLRPLIVDSNYTVIIGSHRNRILKIEKDGLEQECQAHEAPKLSPLEFRKFWINYNKGCITVGTGAAGSNAFYRWVDQNPIPGIIYVGLSSWDTHNCYRNIQLLPPVDAVPGDLPAVVSDLPKVPVPCLMDSCGQCIREQLSMANVCSILEVSELIAPMMDGVRKDAVSFLAENLEAVRAVDPEGFSGLTLSCIQDLLQSSHLVCSEVTLFEAVEIWAQYGHEGGNAYRPMAEIEETLPLIRFPLMPEDHLQALLGHSLAKRSQVLRELISEALEGGSDSECVSPAWPGRSCKAPFLVHEKRHVHALTSAQAALLARYQRRHSPDCRELMFVNDGDHNGVCYFLGTSYGTQDWVNPTLANRLKVTASSPPCRSTDPKALVGRNFVRTLFAGPRVADGTRTTWWQVDLGPGHGLMCNYYTLRQDGSRNFLRSWVFQGSNDGKLWRDLRRHVNDATLKMPGQFASWQVGGRAASVPYRMFRVLMVGPNAAPTTPDILCISYIEFYGYFFREEEVPSGRV